MNMIKKFIATCFIILFIGDYMYTYEQRKFVTVRKLFIAFPKRKGIWFIDFIDECTVIKFEF